jgi:glycine/D-amino acid oxidase-like deaminating enzyme
VLDRELAAVHRAGLSDVALLERGPAAHWTTACLRFPRQAQFHPVKYVAALATCIKNGGGRIYTSTHVDAIRGGTTARVQTGRIQRGV